MTIIVRCNFGKLAVAVSMTIAILFSAGRAIAQGSRIELAQADVSTEARGHFGCILGRLNLSVCE